MVRFFGNCWLKIETLCYKDLTFFVVVVVVVCYRFVAYIFAFAAGFELH